MTLLASFFHLSFKNMYMYICVECRVSWVRVPPEAGKVTALGVLCCFALFVCLFVCLFDLACFFLPSFSHLSLKHIHVHVLTEVSPMTGA